MCRSMVDIQSATAEIRRGKKNKKKKQTTGQKCNKGMPNIRESRGRNPPVVSRDKAPEGSRGWSHPEAEAHLMSFGAQKMAKFDYFVFMNEIDSFVGRTSSENAN